MVGLLVGAIAVGVIFLYGCVGEILTEKAGHLNLGIPGIMCLGAAGGACGVDIYMNSLANVNEASWLALILIAILFASVFGAFGGAIYSFLTVTLRSNQNITGLALTTFGAGFAQFFMNTYVKGIHFAAASRIIKKALPFAKDLGWFGEIFLGHGVLVYFGILVAVLVGLFLKKSKVGLNLRAIGENPATADAAGINVNAYKYGAILIGSAIAGLGGMFYLMDYIGGSWSEATTIESYGWLSIALVIFTLWKPNLSILGAILFGALYISPYVLPSLIPGVIVGPSLEILKIVPYIVTLIVLIVTSILDSKENQPPASLGLNYFREDR